MSNLLLIISREYTTRVKKKSFILATLLMPLLMIGLAVAPAWIASINSANTVITLVDQSGQLTEPLLSTGIPFKFTDEPLDSVLKDQSHSTILVIGADVIENPSDVTLYNREAESLELKMILSQTLSRAVEDIRLKQQGNENVREILASVAADVNINSLTLNDDGETEDSNAMASFIIGIIMAFILYMFILIYGQMVMTSIIEEKNSRVLEIIVTSVKPTMLMLGKLIGVGAVAVTQVAIWLAIIAIGIGLVFPAVVSPEMAAAVSQAANLSYILSISGYLTVFLIGGFFLYASVYATIGASVDNIQDGSQLQIFATFPVIIGLVFATTIGQNPNSAIAVWLSIIPLTSPMVMMARIPAGVPTIEIIASIITLYITILFVIWFAAKVYRIGIFMYGKKPTIKELIKWARYK